VSSTKKIGGWRTGPVSVGGCRCASLIAVACANTIVDHTNTTNANPIRRMGSSAQLLERKWGAILRKRRQLRNVKKLIG